MQLGRRRLLHLAAFAAAAGWPSSLVAQTYPARPVRVLVPASAGGPTDLFARLMAQRLSDRLGRQFYVENIGGASGNIAIGQAARAAPDGYTVLFTYSTFAINPSFFDKVPYGLGDFAPVTLAVAAATSLCIHPSVEAKSVKELIALIRTNPGKFSFGSAGAGTPGHLAGEQFRLANGIDLVHVPFSGSAPAVASTVAGHTPIVFSSLPPVEPHIRERRLRALAVMSRSRLEALPNVPTMAEAGFPQILGDTWIGVLVPSHTPNEIVALLNREVIAVLALRDVREQLTMLGLEPVGSTPEILEERIRMESAIWAEVIKAAHIRPE
jgi:tripartite-type tricarboxylate transporter receptor subunit TctC